jgi:hypothetical protein
MDVSRKRFSKLFDHWPRAAIRAEKFAPHVIVEAIDLPPFFGKEPNALRSYEAT